MARDRTEVEREYALVRQWSVYAERLGFGRLGKRIRAAFASAITGLLRQNRLEHDGSQIRRA